MRRQSLDELRRAFGLPAFDRQRAERRARQGAEEGFPHIARRRSEESLKSKSEDFVLEGSTEIGPTGPPDLSDAALVDLSLIQRSHVEPGDRHISRRDIFRAEL